MTDDLKCECGSGLFTAIIGSGDLWSSSNARALQFKQHDLLQCAACATVHRRKTPYVYRKWERLEFDGAKGEWLVAPE